MTEDLVQPHLAKGRLKRALEDWCPPYSGYHLYYPSRRQSTPAFALLVEALRYRGPNSAYDGRTNTTAASREGRTSATSAMGQQEPFRMRS